MCMIFLTDISHVWRWASHYRPYGPFIISIDNDLIRYGKGRMFRTTYSDIQKGHRLLTLQEMTLAYYELIL